MFISRFYKPHLAYYNLARQELSDGRKISHWMWYIFPQLRGLGKSAKSNFYGLSGLQEASEFLSDPTLGTHLIELCNILLSLRENNPEHVFGLTDTIKFQSSLTIFSLASNNDIFQKLLEKYFGGKKDENTILKLKDAEKEEKEREVIRQIYKDRVISELQDLGMQEEDLLKIDSNDIEMERILGTKPENLAWRIMRKS